MKTLAEFKRDAASGKMSLELLERFGSTNIIDRLKGVRKVIRTNTVSATLLCQDGAESELRFGSAKLIDYDGDTLVIYEPGYRDPTAQERFVLDEWQKISDEYLRQNPYVPYWKMKDYFSKCACPWMAGFEPVRGKKYEYGRVRDNSVRGDTILKYRIYMNEGDMA